MFYSTNCKIRERHETNYTSQVEQSKSILFRDDEQKHYQQNASRLKQMKIRLEQKWNGFFDFGDRDILSIHAKTQ